MVLLKNWLAVYEKDHFVTMKGLLLIEIMLRPNFIFIF